MGDSRTQRLPERALERIQISLKSANYGTGSDTSRQAAEAGALEIEMGTHRSGLAAGACWRDHRYRRHSSEADRLDGDHGQRLAEHDLRQWQFYINRARLLRRCTDRQQPF